VDLFFVETAAFTRRVQAHRLDGALRQLQVELSANPMAGATDAGTGGLRKVRMPDPSRGEGKRGGARVHYLYLAEHAVIYLLFVYGKDEQSTLTAQQKRALKGVVDAIKDEWKQRARR
jgi:hypothetical protein